MTIDSSEGKIPNYENKRFHISESSLEKMKLLRDFFEQLRQQNPEIVGMSFFGSRIIKRETAESDLDLMIFYDGTDFSEKKRLAIESVTDSNDNLKLGVELKHALRVIRESTDRKTNFINSIKENLADKMQSLGLAIDRDKTEETILFTDTSLESINSCLDEFKRISVAAIDEHGNVDSNLVTQKMFQLVSYFFLGVGDGLYKSRKYILDSLQKVPDGEVYFKYLMQLLQHVERVGHIPGKKQVPMYDSYPTSPEEAYEFFLT